MLEKEKYYRLNLFKKIFFFLIVFTFFGQKSFSSPKEKIIHIMNWSLNMSMEMGDTMLIITELWAQASRGHYHGTTSSQLVDFYEEYKIEIEHILEEGIDAGEFRDMNKEGVSTMLMAFLDGLGLQIIIMKNPKVFHKIKSEAIESFMRGILK